MFLTMTTSSGGRGVRSRSRFVEESGEEGAISPNDPNSGDVNTELQKLILKYKFCTLKSLLEPLSS